MAVLLTKDIRRAPTKACIDAMLKKFGICGICSESLSGYYEADHIKPIWEFDREDPDVVEKANHPDNWRPLCKECHKTVTKESAHERAEVYKLSGKTGQKARRKKNGSKFKGGKKLESRNEFENKESSWGESRKLKSRNEWNSRQFGK